ncbi:MAG: glycosyltransferase [Verrucomicrobiales bacterium]
MPTTLSIVIPVWHDTEAAVACLDRLRSPGSPPAEIIFCDATPDPAERARLQSHAEARKARLLMAPRPSRGAQLAQAAAASSGDVIVFSHADTHLEAAHLHALLERLEVDPAVQAGAFHRDVATLYPALSWSQPIVHWYMAELGTLYGDQSPFIRRTRLEQLGGYPSLPLMEDVAFSDFLRRRLARHELALLLPPLTTSPRRFDQRGRWRNKLTNIALTLAWRLGLASAERLRGIYYPESRGANRAKDE